MRAPSAEGAKSLQKTLRKNDKKMKKVLDMA
jgi:hypothetical protein